jgi:hypothetical protein
MRTRIASAFTEQNGRSKCCQFLGVYSFPVQIHHVEAAALSQPSDPNRSGTGAPARARGQSRSRPAGRQIEPMPHVGPHCRSPPLSRGGLWAGARSIAQSRQQKYQRTAGS